MKNAWPVKAQALGGRHYRQTADGKPSVDQNFDVYSVEYIFDDGAKFIMDGRCINGCTQIYNSAAHGTKGMAILSKSGDCGTPSSTYKGQNPDRDKMIWQSKRPDQSNPYQNEWNDLVDAIRGDKPYNEVERGVMASVVSSLGRKAAHTGVEITLDAVPQVRAGVRAGRGQVHDGFAGAAQGRPGRQVPDPDARHRHRSRVLISPPTSRVARP